MSRVGEVGRAPSVVQVPEAAAPDAADFGVVPWVAPPVPSGNSGSRPALAPAKDLHGVRVGGRLEGFKHAARSLVDVAVQHPALTLVVGVVGAVVVTRAPLVATALSAAVASVSFGNVAMLELRAALAVDPADAEALRFASGGEAFTAVMSLPGRLPIKAP